MKFLTLLFAFGCVTMGSPDRTKIYISSTIDGLYEMYCFTDADSVGYILAKKEPGVNADFLSKDNMDYYKTRFIKRKEISKYKYTQKADSIFITRADGFLNTICRGVFKDGKMNLTTTLIVNKEVVKSTPNAVYNPY